MVVVVVGGMYKSMFLEGRKHRRYNWPYIGCFCKNLLLKDNQGNGTHHASHILVVLYFTKL